MSKATEKQLTRLDDSFWEPIRHEQVLLYILPKKGYCNVCSKKLLSMQKTSALCLFSAVKLDPNVTLETWYVTVKYPQPFCSYQDIEIFLYLTIKVYFSQRTVKAKTKGDSFVLPPKLSRFPNAIPMSFCAAEHKRRLYLVRSADFWQFKRICVV